MRIAGVGLSMVAVLVPAAGVAQRAPSGRLPDLVEAIRADYAAIAHRDTSALRKGLADDFRWVIATGGQVVTKPQILAAVAHAPSAAVLRYDVDSAHVAMLGDVALVDYRVTDRRKFGGYEKALASRGTDTFVLRDGGWRLVRRTQTWIVAAPTTIAMDGAALRAFVGRYQHGAGFVDDVHLEGDQLYATSSAESASGMRGAHLLPVSDDAFSPNGVAPLIVFERDANGRITGYVQQSPDGSVARARRLPDATDAGNALPRP